MKIYALTLATVVAVGISGCGVGEAPSGMSDSDAKAAIDRMSPEEKIKFIASSPLPSQEKEARYQQIEKETGVKAADVLAGRPTGTGAGN